MRLIKRTDQPAKREPPKIRLEAFAAGIWLLFLPAFALHPKPMQPMPNRTGDFDRRLSLAEALLLRGAYQEALRPARAALEQKTTRGLEVCAPWPLENTLQSSCFLLLCCVDVPVCVLFVLGVCVSCLCFAA